MSSKKQYRKKPLSDDEDTGIENGDEGAAGGGFDSEALREAIELRKYRKRQHGLDAENLLKGSAKKVEEVEKEPEPQGKTMLEAGVISAGFKTQTKAMDAERHMNDFVEKELQKRRGVDGSATEGFAERGPISPSDALYEIPDHLKVEAKPVSEGSVTLSAAMLTAIPEIDLGIDAKLKNIEETERAKRKLMEERAKRKEGNELAGSNIVAADRWSNNANRPRGDFDPTTGKEVGQTHHHRERSDRRDRATDDMVMERFKKRQKRGR